MHTAHCNLQNIEHTSKEITAAYKLTDRFDNRSIDTEDLGPDSIKFEVKRKASTEHTSTKSTIQILINNIAGVDIYKRKIERIIKVMKSKEVDVFLGQEMNITT